MAETSINSGVKSDGNGPLTAQPWLMRRPMLMVWMAALLVATVFWWFGKPYAAWAFKYPSAWKWKISARITDAMNWLMNEATFGLFTFRELTRGISAVIEEYFSQAEEVLS